ncbi:hypothetical protein BKA65DRAFT_508309 [Rhexocercosporidium sp. MPI-PUGE-AT-0058]|nr:hypothetical protein BKA65DRAFT_508309 [Rhexocercosporidium sp. MPI-PUGE-AT-0058]
MDVDSAASSASSSPGGPSSRAHRGDIASQACETCRSRKQKCDEARPKVCIFFFGYLCGCGGLGIGGCYRELSTCLTDANQLQMSQST